METYILLDNIRSDHNVGPIFRTAECAGVGKIYCVGTTPVPIDRFGRKRKDFAKVSLGAEELVSWERVNDGDISKIVKQLKKSGFKIVAVEQTGKSIDYSMFKKTHLDKKTHSINTKGVAYIFGNEVEGVSKELLKVADVAVEIPMKGKKESLNVAVAAGVILFNALN